MGWPSYNSLPDVPGASEGQASEGQVGTVGQFPLAVVAATARERMAAAAEDRERFTAARRMGAERV